MASVRNHEKRTGHRPSVQRLQAHYVEELPGQTEATLALE